MKTAEGKEARASIAVKVFPKSPHQQYAYLQYKVDGKTITRYVGRVTAETRSEQLKRGWRLARGRKVLEKDGASWVKSPRSGSKKR